MHGFGGLSPVAALLTAQSEVVCQCEDRVARLLHRGENPYCFRCGEIGVKIEFTDNGPPLQDALADFLIRQKSGL